MLHDHQRATSTLGYGAIAAMLLLGTPGCWRQEVPDEPPVASFAVAFELEGLGTWSGDGAVRESLEDPSCAPADRVRFAFDEDGTVNFSVSSSGVVGTGSNVELGRHWSRDLRAGEVVVEVIDDEVLELSFSGLSLCESNAPTPGCEPHGEGTGWLSIIGPREEVSSAEIRPAYDHFHPVSGEPLCAR